jgi:hypothetical protein
VVFAKKILLERLDKFPEPIGWEKNTTVKEKLEKIIIFEEK